MSPGRSLRVTSRQHPHHTFCMWLPRSRPLRSTWEWGPGCRCCLSSCVRPGLQAGIGFPSRSLGSLWLSGSHVEGSAFLLGASLMRLRWEWVLHLLATPAQPQQALVVIITAQLFFSKKKKFSLDLLLFCFNLEWAEGINSQEIVVITLTLKSSFEKPDTSLWKYVYTCCDWRARWKLAL